MLIVHFPFLCREWEDFLLSPSFFLFFEKKGIDENDIFLGRGEPVTDFCWACSNCEIF